MTQPEVNRDFVRELQAASQRMLLEGRRAVLQAAGGSAEHALVSVQVDAGGRVTAIRFTDQVAEATAQQLVRAVVDTYGAAVRRSHAQLVRSVPATIRDAVVAAAPEPDEGPVDDEVRPVDVSGVSLTADDLAGLEGSRDPAVTEWLSIDPFSPGGLQRMRDTMPGTRTGLSDDPAGYQQRVRREMEAMVARAATLKEQVQAVRGEAESRWVRVTVQSSGRIERVGFAADVARRDPADLTEDFLATYAEAVASADAAVRDLIVDAGLDPS